MELTCSPVVEVAAVIAALSSDHPLQDARPTYAKGLQNEAVEARLALTAYEP